MPGRIVEVPFKLAQIPTFKNINNYKEDSAKRRHKFLHTPIFLSRNQLKYLFCLSSQNIASSYFLVYVKLIVSEVPNLVYAYWYLSMFYLFLYISGFRMASECARNVLEQKVVDNKQDAGIVA